MRGHFSFLSLSCPGAFSASAFPPFVISLLLPALPGRFFVVVAVDVTGFSLKCRERYGYMVRSDWKWLYSALSAGGRPLGLGCPYQAGRVSASSPSLGCITTLRVNPLAEKTLHC